MATASVTLRPATNDVDYVETLLAANDLPTADVPEKADCFYVAMDGDDHVGIGGLETEGPEGLLRSIVVEPSRRGLGYGTALCAALEERARRDGVEKLFLLTTTATWFFGDRGYAVVDRSAVPETVRETAEFTDLCPADATCMQKSL